MRKSNGERRVTAGRVAIRTFRCANLTWLLLHVYMFVSEAMEKIDDFEDSVVSTGGMRG